jgi:hypothetical protein
LRFPPEERSPVDHPDQDAERKEQRDEDPQGTHMRGDLTARPNHVSDHKQDHETRDHIPSKMIAMTTSSYHTRGGSRSFAGSMKGFSPPDDGSLTRGTLR